MSENCLENPLDRGEIEIKAYNIIKNQTNEYSKVIYQRANNKTCVLN